MSDKMEIEDISLDEIVNIIKAITGKTREEALSEAIETLRSEDKIKMFSEVDKREIPYIALKFRIAERYELSWLKDTVLDELRLRVSIKRRGRNELVKVATGVKKTLEEKVKGLFRRKKEGED